MCCLVEDNCQRVNLPPPLLRVEKDWVSPAQLLFPAICKALVLAWCHHVINYGTNLQIRSLLKWAANGKGNLMPSIPIYIPSASAHQGLPLHSETIHGRKEKCVCVCARVCGRTQPSAWMRFSILLIRYASSWEPFLIGLGAKGTFSMLWVHPVILKRKVIVTWKACCKGSWLPGGSRSLPERSEEALKKAERKGPAHEPLFSSIPNKAWHIPLC